MAREKSPAFSFYVDDFLGSASVAAMTNEQIGCYWLLVCYLWKLHVLPDDDAYLASLARTPLSRWKRIKAGVMRPCELTEAGWIHDRVEKERNHQREWRAQSSRAGKASAEARRSRFGSSDPRSEREPNVNRTLQEHHEQNVSQTLQERYEPNVKIPIPTPIPSSEKKEISTDPAVAPWDEGIEPEPPEDPLNVEARWLIESYARWYVEIYPGCSFSHGNLQSEWRAAQDTMRDYPDRAHVEEMARLYIANEKISSEPFHRNRNLVTFHATLNALDRKVRGV